MSNCRTQRCRSSWKIKTKTKLDWSLVEENHYEGLIFTLRFFQIIPEKKNFHMETNLLLWIFCEITWWYCKHPGGPPLSSPQINCDTVMSIVRLVDVSAVSNWKFTSMQSIVSKYTVNVRNEKGFLKKKLSPNCFYHVVQCWTHKL